MLWRRSRALGCGGSSPPQPDGKSPRRFTGQWQCGRRERLTCKFCTDYGSVSVSHELAEKPADRFRGVVGVISQPGKMLHADRRTVDGLSGAAVAPRCSHSSCFVFCDLRIQALWGDAGYWGPSGLSNAVDESYTAIEQSCRERLAETTSR